MWDPCLISITDLLVISYRMPDVRQMSFEFAALKSLARRREKTGGQWNEGKTGEGGQGWMWVCWCQPPCVLGLNMRLLASPLSLWKHLFLAGSGIISSLACSIAHLLKSSAGY